MRLGSLDRMGHLLGGLVRRLTMIVLVVAVVIVGAPWLGTRFASAHRIYTTPAETPARDVALVLGAAVWAHGPSPYLQGRLNVAAELYRLGKVKVIVVSGTLDGSYNEPDAMAAALVAAGVPAARIVPDYAGFDTYSSCQRAKEVFGVTALTIVSQAYHLPRAVTTCRLVGVDAIGVGDDSIAHDAKWRGYRLREIAGDMKVVLDVATRRQTVDGETSTAVSDALARS